MTDNLIDILWIIIASGLVFIMQAGFAMVESGLTRSKNSINVAIKNLTDLGVSVIAYWLFGFALMFGRSFSGLIGTDNFFVSIGFAGAGAWTAVFFLFQAMFCSTAATIVSGAVAERMRYGSYIISTILLSAIIYPIYGHWVWGSFHNGLHPGWLESLGFVDFAGSTVVHSVGGWIALAALLILGPRTGRFDDEGKPRKIPGSNIPMVVLGVLLLWFGWFGFNGGSTLALNSDVAPILVNTTLSAASGMVASLAIGWLVYRRAEVGLVLNGALAGLVAITANAHVVTGLDALAIGAVGGLVMLLSTRALESLKIDDAVGAIPVHLAAGIWGTLAVAIFGDPQRIGTGLPMLEQLGVQGIGVAVGGVWSFGTAYIFLWIANQLNPLRVKPEDEHRGLNVTEHGASTEIFDLFSTLETQAASGDLSLRAPVEPFTEVGQIAGRYNQVLDRLEESTVAKDDFLQILSGMTDGLFLIDSRGTIFPYYSLTTERLFETTNLSAHRLQDLLRPLITRDVMTQIEDFIELLFNPSIPITTLETLNPLASGELFFDRSQGTMESKFMDFRFIRLPDNRAMVLVHDKTDEVVLAKKVEQTKKQTESEMELFYRLIHLEPAMLRDFIDGTNQDLAEINRIFQNSGPLEERLLTLSRLVHTIKGDAQLLGLEIVVQQTHEFEDRIQTLKERIPLRHADFLSLAVGFTKLQTLIQRIQNLLSRISRFRDSYQPQTTPARNTSLEAALPRLTQTLAERYGKQAALDMTNFSVGEIPDHLRKTVSDIIIQLLRNSMVHGIESPDDRVQRGKPAAATIWISSTKGSDGGITIRHRDNGQGLRLDAIRSQVITRGILDNQRAQKLTLQELIPYIFYPAVSTAEATDTTAGRGMGMNLVQQLVKRLEGKIEVKTKSGEYCEFSITIPESAYQLQQTTDQESETATSDLAVSQV